MTRIVLYSTFISYVFTDGINNLEQNTTREHGLMREKLNSFNKYLFRGGDLI